MSHRYRCQPHIWGIRTHAASSVEAVRANITLKNDAIHSQTYWAMADTGPSPRVRQREIEIPHHPTTPLPAIESGQGRKTVIPRSNRETKISERRSSRPGRGAGRRQTLMRRQANEHVMLFRNLSEREIASPQANPKAAGVPAESDGAPATATATATAATTTTAASASSSKPSKVAPSAEESKAGAMGPVEVDSSTATDVGAAATALDATASAAEKGNAQGPTPGGPGRKPRLSQTRRGTKFVKDGAATLTVPSEKTADANILGYLDVIKGCMVLLRCVNRRGSGRS